MENTRILSKLPILESMQNLPAARSRLQPSHRSAIAQTFQMRRGADAAPAVEVGLGTTPACVHRLKTSYELHGFLYEAFRRATGARQDAWIKDRRCELLAP